MRPFVIANWKAHPKTEKEALQLFDSVKKEITNNEKAKIIICPPYKFLTIIGRLKSRNKIILGVQDFSDKFSIKDIRKIGCKYVILGHSEKRAPGETDEIINKKIKTALKSGLKPILCVGDKSRKSKNDIKKVYSQLKKDLKGIKKSDFKNVIIAFEPVWAVGTGKNCDYTEAKTAKEFIKKYLPKNVPILYGGSVNSKNAADYIKKSGFDGFLIGGASLNPKEFVKIIFGINKK